MNESEILAYISNREKSDQIIRAKKLVKAVSSAALFVGLAGLLSMTDCGASPEQLAKKQELEYRQNDNYSIIRQR